MSKWLVSTEWLADHLSAPDVVVMDASWHLPTEDRDPKAEYLEEHIPGALFFDIDELSDSDNPLPHMLPAPEKFASRMRRLGVGAPRSGFVAGRGGPDRRGDLNRASHERQVRRIEQAQYLRQIAETVVEACEDGGAFGLRRSLGTAQSPPRRCPFGDERVEMLLGALPGLVGVGNVGRLERGADRLYPALVPNLVDRSPGVDEGIGPVGSVGSR